MARRSVAGVAAVLLMFEAFGIVLAQIFLGMVVDEQQMSLAGLEPHAMTVGAVVGGLLFGGFLLFCAGVLLRTAVRDRAPGKPSRILLIGVAVVHGLLGAFSVGLIGWTAFGFMMIVLGLLVWTLLSYGPRRGAHRTSAQNAPTGAEPPPAPAT